MIFFFFSIYSLIFKFCLRNLEIPEEAKKIAVEKNLELKGYIFEAEKEDLRAPQIVRVGIVQNAIVEPTTAPISQQREAIHNRMREIIEIAALCNVNVICFQEAWSKLHLNLI